jgi:hypothetical protein
VFLSPVAHNYSQVIFGISKPKCLTVNRTALGLWAQQVSGTDLYGCGAKSKSRRDAACVSHTSRGDDRHFYSVKNEPRHQGHRANLGRNILREEAALCPPVP